MWDPDRLHLSPLGHHIVAMAVLDTLGVRHTLVPLEPKKLPESSWRQARADDLMWAKTYLLPWVVRQLRLQGAVEERRAKRPAARPVFNGENPKGPSPALVEG